MNTKALREHILLQGLIKSFWCKWSGGATKCNNISLCFISQPIYKKQIKPDKQNKPSSLLSTRQRNHRLHRDTVKRSWLVKRKFTAEIPQKHSNKYKVMQTDFHTKTVIFTHLCGDTQWLLSFFLSFLLVQQKGEAPPTSWDHFSPLIENRKFMFLAEVHKFSSGGFFSYNVSFLTTKRSHVPANMHANLQNTQRKLQSTVAPVTKC